MAKADGFVKVPLAMLGDATLSDAEYRCLTALESWAWDKPDCWPTNTAIAEQCGWYGKGKGLPARSKVKAVLASLESKGYIGREVAIVAGHHKRDRIVLKRPWSGGLNPGQAGGLIPGQVVAEIQAMGWPKNRPGGGLNLGPELDTYTDPAKQTHTTTEKVVVVDEELRSGEKQEDQPVDLAELERAIEATVELFGDTPVVRADARKLATAYTADHVIKAVALVSRKLDHQESVPWPYLVSIVKKWKADGQPSGTAVARKKPKPTGSNLPDFDEFLDGDDKLGGRWSKDTRGASKPTEYIVAPANSRWRKKP